MTRSWYSPRPAVSSRSTRGMLAFTAWTLSFRRPSSVLVVTAGRARRVAGDAPEADVARRGVDCLGLAGSGPVPAAVIGRAQVGAALGHLARDVGSGPGGLDTRGRGHPRIAWHAARGARIGRMPGCEVVTGPFPDVTDHVMKPPAIGRVGTDGGGSLIAIGEQVLPRELALPGVGHHRPAGRELIPPRVHG